MNNLIASSGKVISSSGRALKQNYHISKGLARDIQINLTLPNEQTDWTIFFLLNCQLDNILIAGEYQLSKSIIPNVFGYDNGGNLIMGLSVRASNGGNVLYPKYTLYDSGGVTIFNILGSALVDQWVGIIPVVLRKTDGKITHKISRHDTVTGTEVINTGLDFTPALKTLSLNVEKPSGVDEFNSVVSRVLVFDRYISDREIIYNYNKGISNTALSANGLISETNCLEASIISEGVIGFEDLTGQNNHFLIDVNSLPVGTDEEKRDYINQNKLGKWN